MEKPIFELQGEMKEKVSGHETIFLEFFDSLEDAEKYAEANMDEYVIHMRMKLSEKRRK